MAKTVPPMALLLAVVICLLMGNIAAAQDVVVLADFEDTVWDPLSQSDEHVREGDMAGKWANLPENSNLHGENIPKDWSGYDRLTFWLHSAVANNQRLTLVAESENDEREGWDYFYYHLRVTWEGWKHVSLDLQDDFGNGRSPVGWHKIDAFRISAGGWGNQPLDDTVLHFDDIKLVRDPASAEIGGSDFFWRQGAVHGTCTLAITNRSADDTSFDLSVRRPEAATAPHVFDATVSETTGSIPSGEAAEIEVAFESRADIGRAIEPLKGEDFIVHISAGEQLPDLEVTVSDMVPLEKREHPMLFGDTALFDRAKKRAETYDWAKERLDAIISTGDNIVAEAIDIPDQGGQWSHYYVCEKCNHRLRYNEEDDTHVCRNCGEVYTGWPYDDVRYTWQHSGNWRKIRDLGLAYQFTGDEKYAEKAREYLLGYAEKYPTFELHDKNGNKGRSGGRAFSQTLNEGVAVIAPAWGYDLIYNSPCLSDGDKDRIEDRFFREVVKTIKRHDAGISNWQSWHNAGIAAVGFCLQDDRIAYDAINGRSGLRFQLENSVLEDGFWYEGTAAYHFYALNALRWTVEAAYHSGLNFYDNEAYVSLYEAPLYYVFPNMQFPAVNDSDVFSLTGRDELYELIYARTKKD
ncbi:MAG: alginate lyase family protein, partial [Armatimonadota bacterium]